MDNQSSSIESLWDRTREYIETRAELLKLKAVDKAAGAISGLITKIILVILLFVFFGLLNIGMAIWIGQCIGEIYLGFFIVAAFYAIAGLVLYLCRNKWIKGPITTTIIKSLMD